MFKIYKNLYLNSKKMSVLIKENFLQLVLAAVYNLNYQKVQNEVFTRKNFNG